MPATLFSVPVVFAIVEVASVARVRSWLQRDASMLPPEAVAPNIIFESDCCSISGAAAYSAAAERWHADAEKLLQPYRSTCVRCAWLDERSVSVRWRAEWVPSTLAWAPSLAWLLQWRIERYDIDPTMVSTFRWGAIARLFRRAFVTGTLRLPAAAVEGSARLTLDDAGELVVLHRETIDLVGLSDASMLQNRRVAQDVAEFLDVARRPDSIAPEDWSATVRARVLTGVPGAGVLDIEPTEGGAEAAAAVSAFAVVAAVGIAVSAALIGGEANGIAFGENENSRICDEVVNAGMRSEAYQSPWYSQCVSDLF